MLLHLRLKIGDIGVPLPPIPAPKYGWTFTYLARRSPSLSRGVVGRVFNFAFHREAVSEVGELARRQTES